MNSQPRGSSWKQLLALEGRRTPELFEFAKDVENTPYAEEIRKAFNELSITAMFCVQGVPTIAILDQSEYDADEVVRIHAALWNQGLASVLVNIANDFVRVFSLAKAPGAADDGQFEDRCLIEAIDAGAGSYALSEYISGAESGRLWREKSEYFNPKERIDYVLLNNLTVANELLVQDHLSPSESQAILIQTMFMAYLEDRRIIGPDYVAQASNKESSTLRDLLRHGNVRSLECLFEQLQRDFNGDLFVAPCSFDAQDQPHRLKATSMEILRRFKEGREEMSASGGQLRFWGYDFKYIPVELISAVYDRFLGNDDSARREAGAYYTPMFLVDSVVSSVWEKLPNDIKSKGTFLDPACGSGIFLVRSFQRMCEHWRENSKQTTIRWDSLLNILDRVRGRDLNGGAVRVAVFSLYIALLEEVTPPDIRNLIDKGRLLPPLWNNTILQNDFFDEKVEELQVDVIIGNPPWTSRRNAGSTGVAWCKKHGHPVPTGEEAWAFTWKSQLHLKNNGVIAFLLPAMGFLHNHAKSALTARVRFFEMNRILRVINFADLRRQLFEGAISPTALIVFEKNSDQNENYLFDYWVPKADLNLSIKRFISLSSLDKSRLRKSDIGKNSLLFKQRMWMRAPEHKLYKYLAALPNLGDFVGQFGQLRKRKIATDTGWVIGQGFKAFRGENSATSSQEHYKSDIVATVPFLPINAFTSIAIRAKELQPWNHDRVHRLGFERAFSGPRVLVSRGIRTSKMRMKAGYANEAFSFHSILQAIAAPPGEADRAKLIAAILNSRIAIWFAFHGTSSFGTFLPEVQQSELLRLPMPTKNDLLDSERSNRAAQKLVALVDKYWTEAGEILSSTQNEDLIFEKIDLNVYDFFGLSEDEIALVEDTVEHILPAAQPNAGTFPDIWKSSQKTHRKKYAEVLIRSLKDWFTEETVFSIGLIASNKDYGILKISLLESYDVEEYEELDSDTFQASLKRLGETINESLDQNFQTIPDLRIFTDNCLYLIKPLQYRFWLKSSALADADSIAEDLQTLTATKSTRGLAS
ncbi:N-6 DNA methylase [Parasphingorhabdus litoris]|uniref:site-specific DNA-methyltransferase (adenine-specific) n=1 Tax=Parasphingorhabdus litoris TaxID=394733 RepID=A0ABN1A0R6_9SPHN|nr:N-6 DNA methylase [Parasphingorhabdus litoris]